MSHELWNENRDKWAPMTPEHANTFILYMIEEIGEVISIVKRKSTDELMVQGKAREHLVEELSDVMMYYADVLNRFGITSEELSQAYLKKHKKNLKRDFESEHKDAYS
jgi:NTP pyrophosphatase (non-canonical NTP hydrolase)